MKKVTATPIESGYWKRFRDAFSRYSREISFCLIDFFLVVVGIGSVLSVVSNCNLSC